MSPNKLSDTQLVLLSAASQREDGAIDPGEGPKGGLAKKAIGKLLTDGLVEEVPADGLLPAWRRDDRGPLALCITARGLAAIGIDNAGALSEAPLLSWGTAEDGDPTPDTPSQRTGAPPSARNAPDWICAIAEATPSNIACTSPTMSAECAAGVPR
jgi:hypothetical protein